ncbi:AmiS/UreI family transporter [Humibacillus sp. DSM 29435]|uniref:AmiS/UreI family transporter n=1 Tax=Humibacillus sp. DSM 29435 TaxID=1869167 RepID=UPI000A6F419E|nr:AmiS/UreI family transporter [Humibacillus sp. DSM 29435]
MAAVSDVGLLFVGAVLIVNGVMLAGRMSALAAAPLNFFVGTLQVVTPTFLIMTAAGDREVIAAASGLYLFGFTYLWVGINAVTGWPGQGLGWFSLFVAVAALGYAASVWAGGGRVFVVIWLAWSVLWFLFFLTLALERDDLTRFTGAVAVIEGVLTAAVPAGLALSGLWRDSDAAAATLAVLLAVLMAVSWRLTRAPGPRVRRPTETSQTAHRP